MIQKQRWKWFQDRNSSQIQSDKVQKFVHNGLNAQMELRTACQDQVNKTRSILLKLEFSSNNKVQVNSRSSTQKLVPSSGIDKFEIIHQFEVIRKSKVTCNFKIIHLNH